MPAGRDRREFDAGCLGPAAEAVYLGRRHELYERAVGGEQVSVTAVLKAAARATSGPVERFESQKSAAPTQEEPPASELQGYLPNPFDDCTGEARDA